MFNLLGGVIELGQNLRHWPAVGHEAGGSMAPSPQVRLNKFVWYWKKKKFISRLLANSSKEHFFLLDRASFNQNSNLTE